jgi:hypothetical protein
VAYALGITNIDPVTNGLLFERFLNPERKSMPDIDTDFCIERRGEVIDYVTKRYGEDKVAQIITYGTMAAKSSVRDTARVLELPLSDADRIAITTEMLPGGFHTPRSGECEAHRTHRFFRAPALRAGNSRDRHAHELRDLSGIPGHQGPLVNPPKPGHHFRGGFTTHRAMLSKGSGADTQNLLLDGIGITDHRTIKPGARTTRGRQPAAEHATRATLGHHHAGTDPRQDVSGCQNQGALTHGHATKRLARRSATAQHSRVYAAASRSSIITPHPSRVMRSMRRMGGGLAISKNRKKTKAQTCMAHSGTLPSA